MKFNTYRLNEGTMNIPASWQDQSMNVFVLPDDSGINLVINRAPVPTGMSEDEFYTQIIQQFKTSLNNYQEYLHQTIELAQQPAKLLEYQWTTPEGNTYQLTLLQIRDNQLITFTYTATTPFTKSQRNTLLDIIDSFTPALDDEQQPRRQ